MYSRAPLETATKFYLVIAVTLGCVWTPTHANSNALYRSHCASLESSAARLTCLSFAAAPNITDRLCAAHLWRRFERSSYYCSGITQECLTFESVNSHAARRLVEMCSPARDGTPCRFGTGTCSRGICVDDAGSSFGMDSVASRPVNSLPQLGGNVAIMAMGGRLPEKSSSWASRIVPSMGRGNNLARLVARNTFMPLPTNLGRLPNASEEKVVVDVDSSSAGRQIPKGFLGVGLEWFGVGYYGQAVDTWAKMFSVFGDDLIIRIGGVSQENFTQVPAEKEWKAMEELHRERGVRFIPSIPFSGNKGRLMSAMVQRARQLGPALVGIELGNEPMYWDCPGMGGWTEDGVFTPGYSSYRTYFDRVARNLTRVGNLTQGCVKDRDLMGPSWDNLNTFTMQDAATFLATTSCYLKEYTLHYYPYYKPQHFNRTALLAEDLMREAARNVTRHVRAAAAFNQTLRITEANSLTGSGKFDTSGTFAAALWTTDLSFEFAAAGVTGLHFHWSFGGLPTGGHASYAGIGTVFFPNGTTAPQVKAPWAGYLLFQAAVNPKAAATAKLGPTTATGAPGRLAPITAAAATVGCKGGQIKVWPVLHPSTQRRKHELRVVVLNKGEQTDCFVVLRLTRSYGAAALVRVLPAQNGTSADRLFAFAGMSYKDYNTELSGAYKSEVVPSVSLGERDDDGSGFGFMVPKATAALLVAQEV